MDEGAKREGEDDEADQSEQRARRESVVGCDVFSLRVEVACEHRENRHRQGGGRQPMPSLGVTPPVTAQNPQNPPLFSRAGNG
jgi:hypothetical protein